MTENVTIINKQEKFVNLNDLLDIFTSPTSKYWIEEINGKSCQVRFVTITPKLAKIILDDFNHTNRPFSAMNINSLVKEMENGNWRVNGETLTFNSEGMLTNGQHRLTALIKADMELLFMVVTGLDSDTFATIDIGRKRASSDVLAINGVASANQAASIVKFIFNFKNDKFSANRSSDRSLSNTEIMDYYFTLNNIAESVLFGVNNSKKSNGLITPTLVGGFHYLLNEVNVEKANDFLIKLCSGLNLTNGSPIIALRNKLIKSKSDPTYRLTNELLIKNILYCWEKHLKGDKVVKIKIPEDYKIELVS